MPCIWRVAGEVGIYPGGSEHGRLSTPNLDTFGREGIKFTNAYAGYTVCAPSRTTFFTGRHSGHFQQNKLPGTSLAPGTATTAAMVLQRAGYTTGLMGKAAPLNNPVEQGFDVFLGQVNQGFCHNMYPHFIDQGNATMNVNLTLNWKNKSRDECMADPPVRPSLVTSAWPILPYVPPS
jgi:arylsulfatase A